MAIRTYYWNTRKVHPLNYYRFRIRDKERMVFRYGNAGDIFNKDLIKFLYTEPVNNLAREKNRLLMVGSIASIIQKEDLICGIGTKDSNLRLPQDVVDTLNIYGVRGPITRQMFKQNNADLSNLMFEYDPGLLIKEVYNLSLSSSSEKNVIFIPHYRDMWVYNGNYPKNLKIVSIDSKPRTLAKKILKAKVVYTSSLHGIIFAHALEKPVVFVKPLTEEPIIKYKDYFMSIGQKLPDPINTIHEYNLKNDQKSILAQEIGLKDFGFPSKQDLYKRGIIE